MEEAPEKGKESSHSVHADEMNLYKAAWEWSKKIETYWSISELYVKVYILILVHLLLSVTLCI
jgi:hypothetical protein